MKRLVLVAAAIAAASPAAAAPTETVIHSFTGAGGGDTPYGGLIADKNGVLYGTTSGTRSNEPNAMGTVFSLTFMGGKKGWVLQGLYHFLGSDQLDGAHPCCALTMDPSGALYGATPQGGGHEDAGTIFKLTPPAAGSTDWTETVLFQGAVDGNITAFHINAPLIRDAAGALFGTAAYGGNAAACPSGCGVAFKLIPPAAGQTTWKYTTLYNFQGGNDGIDPTGGLLRDATGALYGATALGGNGTLCGGTQGCGTIFKLTPPAKGQTAWTEGVLYAFTGGNDGANANGGLVRARSGAFYGTTVHGGGGASDGGVIFKLSPPAAGQTMWTEAALYPFQAPPDSDDPYGGVTLGPGGVLFGTASAAGAEYSGTVFKLIPPAAGRTSWAEEVLYNFQGFEGGTDGEYPYGNLLRDAAGNLYGTTSRGGASGYGTVFEVTP